MSARKSKAKEAKKQARIQQGKILAGAKPTPSREEIQEQVSSHFEARISEVRTLLAQVDRILARRRIQGMISGLGSK